MLCVQSTVCHISELQAVILLLSILQNSVKQQLFSFSPHYLSERNGEFDRKNEVFRLEYSVFFTYILFLVIIRGSTLFL